jgi:glutamine cyclotransferase
MKIKYNHLFILVLIVFIGCKKDQEYITITSNVAAMNNQGFRANDTLRLKFGAVNFSVDSFLIQVNNRDFRTANVALTTENVAYGVNSLKVTYFYDGGRKSEEFASIGILSDKQEAQISYKLEQDYFHNSNSFTQGLFYENGTIYESSGLYDKSFLAKYPLGSKTYSQEKKQENKYFSEGITRFGDKIYLLTWQERRLLEYDFATFELLNTLELPVSIKEGWGICTDGENLIISDGTQYLYFVQIVANQIKIKKTLQIVGYNQIYGRLNELEYIDGFIFANVWQESIILKINPKNGLVEGILDLTALATNKTKDQVLNGIAYIDTKTLLVTGKNWDKMYRIRLD